MSNDNHPDLSESVQQSDDPSKEQVYIQFRQLHVRPWIRFWAKSIDIGVFSAIFNLLLLMVFQPTPFVINIVSSFFVILIWFLVIEPYCLAVWGTTLGRFFLNFTLRNLDGSKLSKKDALSRSFKLWHSGFACGLPILSVIANYLSYRRLKKTGTTSWDKEKYLVTHSKIQFLRLCLALLIMFCEVVIITIYHP
jgi:hypothetical protein